MKILLATDGSPHAEKAAKLLRRLSCREPIELTVLTVTYLPKLGPREDEVDWAQQFLSNEREHADEAFAHVAEIFADTDITVHQVIQHGHAGHAACELALEIDADLIVVGAKGHSALDRMLLGSTSDFVATQAHCSVLIVRPTGIDPSCDGRLGITIGFDGSQRSADAVDQYCAFHWGPNTEVTIVDVVQPVRTIRQESLPGSTAGTEQRLQEARACMQRISPTIQASAAQVKELVIESKHVGNALCDCATQNQSDLLIVGDTGRSELGKLFLGSVTTYVLRHADCSVMICRHRAK